MHNQNKILRVLQLISLLKASPPKRIRYLANVLSSTERTVYRYMDLLTAVGFEIGHDDQNRLYIAASDGEFNMPFTAEENQLMRKLLQTVGKDNPLRDGLLKKLYVHSETHLNADHLLRAHLGKIIENLSVAIQEKKQVILKQYHSVNSNGVSDRLVEPVCFTDNYQSLAAFEIGSEKNKYFNIERISAVELTEKKFRHTDRHKYSTPDVFGFSEANEKHQIQLELSLRAQILLKEQFPMTAPFLKPKKKSNTYIFETTVNDFKPITRFVLGLLDEVKVHGSQAFKEHLNGYVVRMLKG